MNVVIRKRYSKSLQPAFEPHWQVIEKAARWMSASLSLSTDVSVNLKRKNDYYSDLIAYCKKHPSLDRFVVTVYVQKYLGLLPFLIILAHELVHAQQLETNRLPDETEAEQLSLPLVKQYLVECEGYPDHKHLEYEIKMARRVMH